MADKEEPMQLYHFHESNEYDYLFEQGVVDFSNTTNQIGECVKELSHFSDEELFRRLKNDIEIKSDIETIYRERILEEYRPQNDERPSRKECIYLCDEKGLKYWEKQLSYGGKKLQLYKVEVARKPFAANPIYLPTLEDSRSEAIIKAQNYWNPISIMLAYSNLEYLYKGEVKILERVR